MKVLPAAVLTQMQAQQKAPVIICELELSGTTLRYARSKADVVFPSGGNTYYAKNMQVSSITQKTGELPSMSFKLDNVTKDMASWANSTAFYGRKCIVKRIYRDALSSASYYETFFAGLMEEPIFDRQWMSVNVGEGLSYARKLTGTYERSCPLSFGGERCNQNGYANITTAPLRVTGTADSGGSDIYLIDNALTQVDLFWIWGNITVIHDPAGSAIEATRVVYRFLNALHRIEVDLAFPFSVAAGDTYILVSGCSKTWLACSNQRAWGPTADNSANYGGFLHIGDQL